jgi:arylsulfatase A
MNKKNILSIASIGLFSITSSVLTTQASSTSERPNIIFMMADDLGYHDISSFGATAVNTPHIDRLAKEGMKFTQFYSASAVCSPTRASVMTGRYPLRFDIRTHFNDIDMYLPESAGSVAKLLRNAGYATIMIGKWHLGGLQVDENGRRKTDQPGPHQHGFDIYQTQIEQQPLRRDMGRERTVFRQGGTILLRNDKHVTPDDRYYDMHLTDANGEFALEMIEKFAKTGQPFFMNLWWLVPHTPYEPAPEPHWSNTRAEGISDDQHRFRSMVAHMDARVGMVLDKLEEMGIADNTLILFTSDNGAAWEGDIGDLRGGKTDLHEGGIRVPMLARWPGHIPAGTSTDSLANTIDMLPTFCDAAGVTVPADLPVDGISLLPVMKGEAGPDWERDTMFWQLNLYRRIQRHYDKPQPYATEIARNGKWKMLSVDGEPVALFDVENDPNELRSLLTQHPEIASDLGRQVRAWLDEPRERTVEQSPAGRHRRQHAD